MSVRSSVVGNGDGSDIGKDGKEDNEVDTDSLIENKDGKHQIHFKVDTKSNTIRYSLVLTVFDGGPPTDR